MSHRLTDGWKVRIASSWNELTSTVSTSNGCFSRANVGRRFRPDLLQYRFDVFAGAERVGFEIGAGAIVVAQLEAAQGDDVFAAGSGVADVIIAEELFLASPFDDQPFGFGPGAAEINLFFAEHGSI